MLYALSILTGHRYSQIDRWNVLERDENGPQSESTGRRFQSSSPDPPPSPPPSLTGHISTNIDPPTKPL